MWQLWQVFLSLMANVFWQNKLRASVHSYGKYNHGKNIMANKIEPNVGFPANINFCEKKTKFRENECCERRQNKRKFSFFTKFRVNLFRKNAKFSPI